MFAIYKVFLMIFFPVVPHIYVDLITKFDFLACLFAIRTVF